MNDEQKKVQTNIKTMFLARRRMGGTPGAKFSPKERICRFAKRVVRKKVPHAEMKTFLGDRPEVVQKRLRCSKCSGMLCGPKVLHCGHVFCTVCIEEHFEIESVASSDPGLSGV